MKNDDYGKMSNDDQMNGLDVIEVVNQSSNPLINQEMGPPQTIKLQVIIFFKSIQFPNSPDFRCYLKSAHFCPDFKCNV